MNFVAYADHIVGGEIRYQFVKTLDNRQQVYNITTTIYRDALGGGAGFDNPFYLTVYNLDDNTYTNKSLLLIGSRISPIGLNDLGACAKGVPTVQFQEIFYQFTDTVNVNDKGYLYVHQRCCRSSVITNLVTPNQQGSSFTVHLSREAMLYNNSNAVFPSAPPILMCIKSNFKYQFNATDPNGNQLKYSLCDPYYGADLINEKPITASPPPYSSVQYSPNYSFSKPFGDDVYVDLDSNTGLLRVESDRIGYFTLAVCVDELNDQGRVIASTKRDFLFNVSNCLVATARAKVEGAQETSKDVFATCESSEIQFRNESIDAQSYFWDFGVNGIDNDTSILAEPNFTYSDSGTYQVTLIINKGNTCADTTKITLKVYPTLKADFEYLLDCEKKQIQLFNSSTSPSNPINEFTWYNDQKVISNEDTFLYQLPEVGTYQFRLKTKTEAGCIDSIGQAIDLIPFSKASFTNSGIYNAANDHYVVCSNEMKVSFSSQSNHPSFLWQINQETKTEKNFTYVFPDTGNYKVELIVNPNTFCSDTSTQWIRILPPIKADFSTISTCQDKPTLFQIETDRDFDTIFSAFWNFGDGKTSNELSPENIYAKTQSYTVQLSLQTQAGCTNDVTKTIDISPNLIADFEILDLHLPDSSFVVCSNPANIQFKNFSKNATSYSWTIGDQLFQSNDIDISHSFLDTGVYSIQLISDNDINCTDTSIQSFQIIKDIQKIDFSYLNNCALTQMKMKNESQIFLNDIADYYWDFGNGSTSSKNQPDVMYTASGEYEVILKIKTQLGCIDSIIKKVTIRGALEPIILQSQDTICVKQSIKFDATNSKGEFQSYFWDFGNGKISNRESRTIFYNQEGTYIVGLSLEDSICGTFDTNSIVHVISIPEIDLIDTIKMCSYEEKLLKIDYPSAFDSILWSTGEKDTLQINTNSTLGNIVVEIFYKGCEVKDSIIVTDGCDISFPQIFSPNGDGVNDYFNIIPYNIKSYQLTIYSRSGHLIFYTDDINYSWNGSINGQELPTDNYIFYSQGIQMNGQPFEIQGTVLLFK